MLLFAMRILLLLNSETKMERIPNDSSYDSLSKMYNLWFSSNTPKNSKSIKQIGLNSLWPTNFRDRSFYMFYDFIFRKKISFPLKNHESRRGKLFSIVRFVHDNGE